jgi:hypothetical protein
MGNKDVIWISKGSVKIMFDIKIPTATGAVCCVYLKCAATELNKVATEKVTISGLMEAHEKRGHVSEDATIETEKALCWEHKKGSMTTCAICACAHGKKLVQ